MTKIKTSVADQEKEIEQTRQQITDIEIQVEEMKKPKPDQQIKDLEAETSKLKRQIQETNSRIDDYINDVNTQLSEAEQWLIDQGEMAAGPGDEDRYQQALIQSSEGPAGVKSSTGGSSKLRSRPI